MMANELRRVRFNTVEIQTYRLPRKPEDRNSLVVSEHYDFWKGQSCWERFERRGLSRRTHGLIALGLAAEMRASVEAYMQENDGNLPVDLGEEHTSDFGVHRHASVTSSRVCKPSSSVLPDYSVRRSPKPAPRPRECASSMKESRSSQTSDVEGVCVHQGEVLATSGREFGSGVQLPIADPKARQQSSSLNGKEKECSCRSDEPENNMNVMPASSTCLPVLETFISNADVVSELKVQTMSESDTSARSSKDAHDQFHDHSIWVPGGHLLRDRSCSAALAEDNMDSDAKPTLNEQLPLRPLPPGNIAARQRPTPQSYLYASAAMIQACEQAEASILDALDQS